MHNARNRHFGRLYFLTAFKHRTMTTEANQIIQLAFPDYQTTNYVHSDSEF